MTIPKNEAWKEKIRAGVLVQRLMEHAEGKIEMTGTQIKAADILIKKVIPDLNRTEMTGLNGGTIKTEQVSSEFDKQILENFKKGK